MAIFIRPKPWIIETPVWSSTIEVILRWPSDAEAGRGGVKIQRMRRERLNNGSISIQPIGRPLMLTYETLRRLIEVLVKAAEILSVDQPARHSRVDRKAGPMVPRRMDLRE
jgi:hypothetical protein